MVSSADMRRLFVFLAVTSLVLAVPRPDTQSDDYNYYDGCWVSAIQQYIPVGASVPSPTLCEGYRCTSYGVVIDSCSAVVVSPPCFVTVNEFLPFPGCCMQGVCPTTEEQLNQS